MPYQIQTGVVTTPGSNITFMFIDKDNSIANPTVETGANCFYGTTSAPGYTEITG